jgi:fucose 4-O-acetylase-like acetyltransferase
LKTNYIVSFDYFRVFSILVIVLGHTLTKSFQSDYPFLTNVIKGGGSLFFVFISGYLFCLLLPKIKGYLPFITSKFKRLVVPYIIFSIPLILYRYIESDSYLYNIDFEVSSIYYPILSILTGIHMTPLCQDSCRLN